MFANPEVANHKREGHLPESVLGHACCQLNYLVLEELRFRLPFQEILDKLTRLRIQIDFIGKVKEQTMRVAVLINCSSLKGKVTPNLQTHKPFTLPSAITVMLA